MRGLVPRIHVFVAAGKTWMAATSAAMTVAHFIVGMMNSAPSLVPEGQREVTVFVLV
jgi:hypothetical protein